MDRAAEIGVIQDVEEIASRLKRKSFLPAITASA